MKFFGIAVTVLYGLFIAACVGLIVYLIIKRVGKKEDFENREN